MKKNDLKIIEAKTFNMRLFGLMFKNKTNYGLKFNNCKSIHTFFMKFNLDVYAYDKNDNLIKTYKNIKPWRIIIAPLKTKYIIEIPTK